MITKAGTTPKWARIKTDVRMRFGILLPKTSEEWMFMSSASRAKWLLDPHNNETVVAILRTDAQSVLRKFVNIEDTVEGVWHIASEVAAQNAISFMKDADIVVFRVRRDELSIVWGIVDEAESAKLLSEYHAWVHELNLYHDDEMAAVKYGLDGTFAVEEANDYACRISPTFDKDGYPTGETLEHLRTMPVARHAELLHALTYIQEVWHWPDLAKYDSETGFLTLSTGGWSGNEDVIKALRQNVMFWTMTFWQFNRGGHYMLNFGQLNVCTDGGSK